MSPRRKTMMIGPCIIEATALAGHMSDVYALKQPHPDGGEWIQEHDSLEAALSYQSYSGGVLVKLGPLPGQPGLWWVEVDQALG